MKFLPSQLLYFFQSAGTRRNVGRLLKFIAVLMVLAAIYSVLFHVIMKYEGRDFSWLTGLYWTLTVMSTLGFGDITFVSDLGRAFSIVVLVSGMVFLLVMLPFTFIQFFYAPWLEAHSKARAPRELPADSAGHVILTSFDPIGAALVKRLAQDGYQYSFLVPELPRALEISDQDYRVVFGALDDPETYRRLRADRAALVVVTNDDLTSTNIAFTVREVSEKVRIVTSADSDDSEDILGLAGGTHVFQFTRMLGRALGRRVLGAGMRANVIGRFDQLLIAEAVSTGTLLEGKSLSESRLREVTGVTVVGLWNRGAFQFPHAHTRIAPDTVLVLAGSEAQFRQYDELMSGQRNQTSAGPVLILGAGRVGRAAAEVLEERKIDYRIVENDERACRQDAHYILGSAADRDTLVRAGIQEAPTVIVTTHSDDLNIYLTIFCHRLRPELQIISRATLERNVSTLHRAGADMVMSYASMAASTILDVLRPNQLLLLEEGLEVFRARVHPLLGDLTLRDTQIREQTGCNVIAINTDGHMHLNPDPSLRLRAGEELILIGTSEAEESFVRRFPKHT